LIQLENEKLMKAYSYKIALLIIKDNKQHTIGESLIKPYLLTAYKTVFKEESCAIVAKILL